MELIGSEAYIKVDLTHSHEKAGKVLECNALHLVFDSTLASLYFPPSVC